MKVLLVTVCNLTNGPGDIVAKPAPAGISGLAKEKYDGIVETFHISKHSRRLFRYTAIVHNSLLSFDIITGHIM